MIRTATEGVAWLESLAAHYEATAQRIRDTVRSIKEAEQMLNAVNLGEASREAGGGMFISQAIMEVLRSSEAAMTPARILSEIHKQRIPVRTSSQRLPQLVNVTLGRMEGVGDVKRTGRGLWVICRKSKDPEG